MPLSSNTHHAGSSASDARDDKGCRRNFQEIAANAEIFAGGLPSIEPCSEHRLGFCACSEGPGCAGFPGHLSSAPCPRNHTHAKPKPRKDDEKNEHNGEGREGGGATSGGRCSSLAGGAEGSVLRKCSPQVLSASALCISPKLERLGEHIFYSVRIPFPLDNPKVRDALKSSALEVSNALPIWGGAARLSRGFFFAAAEEPSPTEEEPNHEAALSNFSAVGALEHTSDTVRGRHAFGSLRIIGLRCCSPKLVLLLALCHHVPFIKY